MITKELIISLAGSDDAVSGLSGKSRDELSGMFGNDFAVMKDFAQNNPHHCYDLLEHTIHTVLNISRDGLPQDDFIQLRIAALFHDIGKPRTARQKGSKTVFYNHSAASGEIAGGLLREIGFTGEETERILFYITHHDDFINYKFENKRQNPYFVIINEENLSRLIRSNTKKCKDEGLSVVPDAAMHAKLSLLCAADVGAQSEEAVENGRTVDTRKDKIERMLAIRDIFTEIDKKKHGSESGMGNLQNKSFFFIPFSTEKSLESLSGLLDESGTWTAVRNDNVRYLMNYVAARIKSCYDGNAICIQRKLDMSQAPGFLSREFTAFYKKHEDNTATILNSFKFTDASLFCFDTGICFAVLEIEHTETDCVKICDDLFQLRFAKKHNLAFSDSEDFEKNGVSLVEICKEILPHGAGFTFINKTADENSQQINILSYLETDISDEEELRKQLFYMSHCYNQQFDCTPDTDDTFITYNNNSVCKWGITTDAAVCISFPEGKQENFIRDTFRKNIRSGYLLMYVLLLHQKYELYNLIEKVGSAENAGSDPADGTDKLKNIRKDFYTFERNYNFRIISGTAQYQNIYRAIYEANQIDLLMEDVKEPLEAINSILDEDDHKREEKDAKKTENALAILSVLTIFSTLIDAWGFIRYIPDMISGKEPFLVNIPSIIVSVLIIVFFAVFGKDLFSSIRRKKEK